jgi:hypothetical protein
VKIWFAHEAPSNLVPAYAMTISPVSVLPYGPAADVQFKSGARQLELDPRLPTSSAAFELPQARKPGDIVTLVAGQRHLLRDSTRTPPRPTIDDFARAAVKPEPRPRTAAGRTRLLIMSAPRDSNQFVSVYPSLVAIPRTARDSHAFLQRVVRLIEMELATRRPGQESVMRHLAELVVIELVRFALPRLPKGPRTGSAGSAIRTSAARSG